jgi:lysyl-tRNA synthetase class 2
MTIDDSIADWLDWLLVVAVAPAFDHDGFTFLYDYPVSQCSLARIESDASQQRVAKRFELFYGEIELANGFDELTDALEQRSRFLDENALRASLGKSVAEIDTNLIAALEYGLPQCSGVAMGLDRLLMILTQADSIDGVIAFPWGKS